MTTKNSNEISTIVECANTSINYTSFQTPSSYIEVSGQRRLIFARKKEGTPFVVANREDTDRFVDALIEHGCADAIPAFKKGDSPSLQGAVDYQKSFILAAFYLMLQDKLHEINYKSDCIKFNGTEICMLLGIETTNRLWAKKAFMTAALIIGAVWVELKEMTRALGYKKFIHIIQSVEEIRGGFSVKVDPGLLPIWHTKTKKIAHDITLYKVDDRSYKFAWRIGRKLEEMSERNDWFLTVTVSAQTLFNVCTELPETYTNPREYSKRIKWLETNLNHLKSINFLSKWEWANGRPTNIESEQTQMLHCTFASERHDPGENYAQKHQNLPQKSKRKPKKQTEKDPKTDQKND
jgi:hypothetical protein